MTRRRTLFSQKWHPIFLFEGLLDFINERFYILVNKWMKGGGKVWYFWKFYFRKQSGEIFPQRSLWLANILDGTIDQLRGGGICTPRQTEYLRLWTRSLALLFVSFIKIIFVFWMISKHSNNDIATIETFKARNDTTHSTDGPYLVSRDKTESEILSKLSKNNTATMETLKILVLSCPYSTDGPYLVSRDKTEPGPLFLKELSNYTVRHVNAVCVHILRSIFAIRAA